MDRVFGDGCSWISFLTQKQALSPFLSSVISEVDEVEKKVGDVGFRVLSSPGVSVPLLFMHMYM